VVRVEESRYIAERIPGSRLVEQDGEDHFMAHGADEVLDVVEPFIVGLGPVEPHPAVLVAVVAVAGPADRADEVLAALADLRGRRRRAAGRVVVVFDGPATAVRAVRQVPLDGVSIGLSIAEVARDGDAVVGPGVDTALALADAGAGGGVVASDAVQILLAGSSASLPANASGGAVGGLV
jgi:hypothetical protein